MNMSELDWDLIRAVLAVADAGSLSAAARVLGQSQPTLGRQIKLAEAQLGQSLFDRHARGLALTAFGQSLLPAMRQMEAGARSLSLAAAGQDDTAAGVVRLTASKFVSAFLLPQVLTQLRRDQPEITVDLVPSDTTENLLFHEADLALRMYRPTQLEMVARHLGQLELGLFASEDYLARRGTPQSWEDFQTHDVLGYDRDDRLIRGMRALGFEVSRDFFAFHCDDQVVYWHHVVAGMGIGVGQRAVAQQDPNLRPVLPELELPRLPVWLTAHESLRHVPRIARVWDALATGLSPLLS